MKNEIKKLWNMINSIFDDSENENQNSKNSMLIIVVFVIFTLFLGGMAFNFYNKGSIVFCIVVGYVGIISLLITLIIPLIFTYRKNNDKKIRIISFIKSVICIVWRIFVIAISPSLLLLLLISYFFDFINLKNIGKDVDNLSLSSLLLGIWTLFAIILFSPYEENEVGNINLKYIYYTTFFIFYFIAKMLEILSTKLLCKKSYDRMCLMIDINKIKSLFFTIIVFVKAIFGDITIGFAFIILINYSYNILKQINHFDRKSKYKDFLAETLLKLEQYNNIIITAENNIEDEKFFRYITSFKNLYTYMNSIYPGALKEISLGKIKMYNIQNNSKKKDAIFIAMNSIESLVTLNETDIETIKVKIRETQNLICNCYKIRMYF